MARAVSYTHLDVYKRQSSSQGFPPLLVHRDVDMNRIARFFRVLGPGLITGAADDDPSGISTYSVAGASAGYSMLWLTLITTPMMAVIQGMCARISMVTGVGLAEVIRKRLPRALAYALAVIVILSLIHI